MQRRTFVAGVGATITSTAGCLQLGSTLGLDGETPTDDTTDDRPGGLRSREDELSIGGRLDNAADDARTFAIRIRDEDGERVFEGEITVAGDATKRVPAWGAPGGTRTVSVTVDGTTAVETLAFDVEPGGSRVDGYVDVRHAQDGSLDVGFTPLDERAPGGGLAPIVRDHAVSDRAVAPDVERSDGGDPWGLLAATRATAESYFGTAGTDGGDDVRAFVEGTAFDAGERLLYVEASAPRTCYGLALADDPHVAADGRPHIPTILFRTAPDDVPCGEAVTPVRLLLRLSFAPGAGDPDAVVVHVDGHRDRVEQVRVGADRRP